MSIGGGIVLNPTFGTGGGSTPATFTLDPDPFDIGTAISDTAELTSDRLAGVRVSLDGAIAAVASIATPLSWDGGGCGEGYGDGYGAGSGDGDGSGYGYGDGYGYGSGSGYGYGSRDGYGSGDGDAA